VHRHDRAGQTGGLWQEGYRVPCNCAVVGGLVDGRTWDAFQLGHHYRCIWWSFQEGVARDENRRAAKDSIGVGSIAEQVPEMFE